MVGGVSKSLLWLPILLLVIPGCGRHLPYPSNVHEVLTKAGKNRRQLEKIIAHYQTQNDSLKLKAAYFLIENMEGHGYVTYALQDTAANELPFVATAYPDYPTLEATFDSLEAVYGTLDFEKRGFTADLEVITAEFLIEQIEYAFKAWQGKPWAAGLSFEDFCEYILPYRGSNEPLENWRGRFYEKYQGIDKRLENPADPISAAALINDDIKSWFKFDPRYYYHPTDQGLAEMTAGGLGRCEDMTNITIYAMRAVGLAVTSDYTPYWANAGNNHAWNAIVTLDGKAIPFMGAEANPGQYGLANKLAKVYRKTYGVQKGNLVFVEHKQTSLPPWLAGKSYRDVTAEYVQTCDVTVRFDREIPDSVNVAYLCVFNSGEWKAIQWGKIDDDSAVFRDMGTGIAYLPALYLNEEIVPFGQAFVLQDDCRSQVFRPDQEQFTTLRLVSTTARLQRESTDGITGTGLVAGLIYELFYWDDDWQSLGKLAAGLDPLVFDRVPRGSLFRLVADNSDDEERIFSFENGYQVWW